MVRYIVNRLFQSVVLIVFVSMLTFFLIHSAPGGPAVLLAPGMTKEQIEQARKDLGFDDPIPMQYARWAGRVVRGNLGNSYSQGLPVSDLLARRLPETLELVFTGLALATIVGVIIGIVSAKKQYSLIDKLSTGFCFFGMSVPVFWFGLMLIIFFSINLKIVPSSGSYTLGAPASIQDRLSHLILPAVVLATANLALIARYTRSSMLEVLNADYLRTARAKGLKESVVMSRHALRNALIPIVTVVALMIPRLVSGVAITESVFAWPGMGSLAVDSAVQRDYPVVMGITLMVSMLVVVTNFITDLSYLFLDPRVKLK
jgi:peptide/nickel transport system permease protein